MGNTSYRNYDIAKCFLSPAISNGNQDARLFQFLGVLQKLKGLLRRQLQGQAKLSSIIAQRAAVDKLWYKMQLQP